MKTADVVVIGGGVIGAACAEAVSREKVRVVLIERLGMASGASSACQSGIGYSPSSAAYDLRLDQLAMQCYRDFAASGAQIDYVRQGGLMVCEPQEAESVRSHLDVLIASGFDCEWLDAEQLKQAEPRLAPNFAGALFLKELAQVSPMRVVNELARRVQMRGGEIQTNTQVTNIETINECVSGIETTREKIATENVIIAAGAWSSNLAEMIHLKLPVLPLKGHVLVTEPAQNFLQHYVTAAGYETGVSATLSSSANADGAPTMPPQVAAVLQNLPSGQILIGSSREFAGYDREVNRARLAQIARRACAVVPALAQLRVIRTYAGLRPWSPDGRPLIGKTERVRGIYFATGHAGEGNTRALITARILADIFMGRVPPTDPSPLAPDRFALN